MILTYHRFSESPSESSVSRKEFAEHLRYLRKNTNILALPDAVRMLRDGSDLPVNPAVITIDDGYRDSYEIAFPLLREFDVPATLYVITGFVNREIWLWTDIMRYVLTNTSAKVGQLEVAGERVPIDLKGRRSRMAAAARVNSALKKIGNDERIDLLKRFAADLKVDVPDVPPGDYEAITWQQAREMDSQGLGIECHTANHPMLTKIGAEEIMKELLESRSVISQELDRDSLHFCYPNGAYNEAARESVETAGFESAVTTDYGFCGPETDRFLLKRIDGQPAIASFAQSVSGFEEFREKIGI